MYWQDHYKNPAQAVAVLNAAARGKIRLTPQMAHIAHVAARAGLAGISEDPSNLGAVPYRLTEDSDFLGNSEFGYDHAGVRGFGFDRDGLRGISALDFARMGGLKSDIKKALKSGNVAKIQSALARESAKLAKAPDSKKAPKRLAYVNQLQAQLAVASAGTPTTAVLPGAPEQPIPQLSTPAPTDPMSFSQGGGGGGGFAPSAPAAPVPGDTVAADSGLSMPVMIGIGAGALLLLYLLTRKH